MTSILANKNVSNKNSHQAYSSIFGSSFTRHNVFPNAWRKLASLVTQLWDVNFNNCNLTQCKFDACIMFGLQGTITFNKCQVNMKNTTNKRSMYSSTDLKQFTSPATLMSQQRAISSPPPKAVPSKAAITGTGSSESVRVSLRNFVTYCATSASVKVARCLRSAPDVLAIQAH